MKPIRMNPIAVREQTLLNSAHKGRREGQLKHTIITRWTSAAEGVDLPGLPQALTTHTA